MVAILAIVCGLLAWGNAISAVGTVPGDFGKAVVLTCVSLLLSTAALFRALRFRNVMDPMPAVVGVILAGILVYLAIANLAQYRW